jgi:hypothetical protein
MPYFLCYSRIFQIHITLVNIQTKPLRKIIMTNFKPAFTNEQFQAYAMWALFTEVNTSTPAKLLALGTLANEVGVPETLKGIWLAVADHVTLSEEKGKEALLLARMCQAATRCTGDITMGSVEKDPVLAKHLNGCSISEVRDLLDRTNEIVRPWRAMFG